MLIVNVTNLFSAIQLHIALTLPPCICHQLVLVSR